MCGIGLRLIRPSARAVGSPKRFAVQAWAVSWTVSDRSRIAYFIAIRGMSSWERSMAPRGRTGRKGGRRKELESTLPTPEGQRAGRRKRPPRRWFSIVAARVWGAGRRYTTLRATLLARRVGTRDARLLRFLDEALGLGAGEALRPAHRLVERLENGAAHRLVRGRARIGRLDAAEPARLA